jgi:hypothetical protein
VSFVRPLIRVDALILRHPRACLALLAFAVFALVTHGDFADNDTARRLQVTHSLWTEAPPVAAADLGSAKLSAITAWELTNPLYCDLPGRGGAIYGPFGLGQSLVMLPGDILASALLAAAPRLERATAGGGKNIEAILVNVLTFPLLSAAGLVLSFELLLLLRFTPGVALGAALLLLVATTFAVYMQDVEENGQIYLCYVASLVFALRCPQRGWGSNGLIAGGFAGFNLLFKITNIVYLPALFGLAAYLRLKEKSERTQAAAGTRGVLEVAWFTSLRLGPPIIVALGIDRWYQHDRFGDWTGTFLRQCVDAFTRLGNFPADYPLGYDKLAGFLGPLVSGDKSVFLFDPFLIFGAIFFAFYFRRMSGSQKLVLLGTSIAFFGILAAFAGTYWWNGSSRAWGPRHHLVPVELMCLLAFAYALREFSRFKPLLRMLVALNMGVAMIVQGLALPMSPIIESRQLMLGDSLGVLPLMRARNLFYMARGEFDRPSLTHNDPIIADAARDRVDRILAFRLTDYVPQASAASAQAAWLALALILASVGALIFFAAVHGEKTASDLYLRDRGT